MLRKKRFIFGIGSGRCGTLSLARLLDSQPDARVTHEMRPLLGWDAPEDEKRRIAGARLERLARESDAGLVGDVAAYYLPYIPFLLEGNADVRIVCLRRPRQEVIASFIQWLERTESLPVNHWLERPWKRGECQRQFHSLVWSRIFPKYPDVSLEEGIGRYWDEYYAEVERLQARFQGRVLMLETYELNQEEQQRQLLRFCAVEEKLQRIGRQHENISSNTAQRRRNTSYASPDAPENCVVLVPYAEGISESCEEGLRQLENKGYAVRRISTGKDETLARNRAVMEALGDGFLETMWIDSSVRFHPDSVATLRAHQSDLACTPVFGASGPQRGYVLSTPATAMRFGQSGDVVNVDAAALSFLHVRRHVYDEIAARLKLPLIEEPKGNFVPFFVPTYRAVEDGYRYSNAAETFCAHARRCGFSILADCRVRVWNTEPYAFSWEESGLARDRQDDMVLRFPIVGRSEFDIRFKSR
ncbi:MAG: hypothetical protein ACTHK7_14230 [Aureliella sp.]